MFGSVANYYEEEFDTAVADLSTLIEPIMIVFMGVTIGGLMLAMYSPLFSVGELIGAMATVATLLYLAFQIRANTQAAKYTSIKDIINSVVGWLSRLGDSEEMMDCWTLPLSLAL